jgi:hypothetical protein
MRLTELNPHWFTVGGSPDIVGVTFDCPCCAPDGKVTSLGTKYRPRLGVLFIEEIDRDGLPNDVHWTTPGKKWHRAGETFDMLTLSPSINCEAFGHWHGFIQNGEVR